MTLHGMIKNRRLDLTAVSLVGLVSGCSLLPIQSMLCCPLPSLSGCGLPSVWTQCLQLDSAVAFIEEAKHIGEEFLKAVTLVLAAGLDHCLHQWGSEEEQQ